MLSIDEMMRHPGSTFKDPMRVLEHPELSSAQKLEILKQWKNELIQRQKAEEENMSSEASDPNLLQAIQNALELLKPDG